jgi:integrase
MKRRHLIDEAVTLKPNFGSIVKMKGSKWLYIDFYYCNVRKRLPTAYTDTPENRELLCTYLNLIGAKIKNKTFRFADEFSNVNEEMKEYFSRLEGREYKPSPEHVNFGEYARKWMEHKLPTFATASQRQGYRGPLESRIIPYFEHMPFSSITASGYEEFVNSLERCNRAKNPKTIKANKDKPKKPLSVKRIKAINTAFTTVWLSACNKYDWILRDPLTGIGKKLAELQDKIDQRQARDELVREFNGEEEEVSRREIFLLHEWQTLLSHVDPHYHPVMDLLLMGLIGSELEALLKQHIKGGYIRIRCAISRKDKEVTYKFKPKNWYRKRDLVITERLRKSISDAMKISTSNKLIRFDNDITIVANKFVLTMKNGSPFNYASFRKTVWDPAIKKTGLSERVPYASRHTLVEWARIIGVAKPRLVDIMGHSSNKMIDEVYGDYRKGLVEEREQILDFLGEDFLALEELKITFPERYRQKMLLGEASPKTCKAPVSLISLSESRSEIRELYPDNYLK